jgi:hypothetical protein
MPYKSGIGARPKVSLLWAAVGTPSTDHGQDVNTGNEVLVTAC